jgi:hypothetical protein
MASAKGVYGMFCWWKCRRSMGHIHARKTQLHVDILAKENTPSGFTCNRV